jgi:transposase
MPWTNINGTRLDVRLLISSSFTGRGKARQSIMNLERNAQARTRTDSPFEPFDRFIDPVVAICRIGFRLGPTGCRLREASGSFLAASRTSPAARCSLWSNGTLFIRRLRLAVIKRLLANLPQVIQRVRCEAGGVVNPGYSDAQE